MQSVVEVFVFVFRVFVRMHSVQFRVESIERQSTVAEHVYKFVEVINGEIRDG